MVDVVFTQSAQTDLLEAWLFIAENNPPAADHVLDTIEHAANLLSLQPLMGRARPELAPKVRSWPTSTSYILYYQVNIDHGSEAVTVLRVLHHAREIRQLDF